MSTRTAGASVRVLEPNGSPAACDWRLHPRREGVRGDAAIREAISKRSATMSFDRHLFAYRDDELPQGGHVLSLTPLPRDGEEDVLEGYTAEQRVPPGLPQWDDESRWRLVLAMGHALFDDVARLVTIYSRFN